MNRQDILNKIRAMMALQESTNFHEEADAASKMIDRLCKKYGVDPETDLSPQVIDEVFASRRFRTYTKMIFNAVANFYDAMYYYVGTNRHLIGTEAQQIQTRLYYEYIAECMEREAQKAYEGEKFLAELQGRFSPTSAFLNSFKQSFALKVVERLRAMKQQQNRVHEHKQLTAAVVGKMKFRKGASLSLNNRGGGYQAGTCAGESVSLHKQTSGSGAQRQLAGV